MLTTDTPIVLFTGLTLLVDVPRDTNITGMCNSCSYLNHLIVELLHSSVSQPCNC